MTESLTSDATSAHLSRARTARAVAVMCLLASPVAMFLAATGSHAVLEGVPDGPGGVLWFVLTCLAGAVVGLPGIVLGRRVRQASGGALAGVEPSATIGRDVSGVANTAIGIGIVTWIVGCVFHVIFFLVGSLGAPGRPFRRRGRPQRAEVCASRDWCGSPPLIPLPDADERARRAAQWTNAARAEHASIASFCRTALDLLALGAPPDLIERVLQAAMEEVTHARLSFSLASAYTGAPISAGEFGAAADGRAPSRLAFAATSIADGWVNEGISSASALASAREAEHAEEREALTLIAADEARHAMIGRDLARWALGRQTL